MEYHFLDLDGLSSFKRLLSQIFSQPGHKHSKSDITDFPTNFSGATNSSVGNGGLVPAPNSGQQDYYLKGDGTWSGLMDEEITQADIDSLLS